MADIFIPKLPKEGDPAKMSPMDEWAHRNRAWDLKTDSAIRAVRKRQNTSRWTFGMPKVSQEEWDRIFGKKDKNKEKKDEAGHKKTR